MPRRLRFLTPNAAPTKPWSKWNVFTDVLRRTWTLAIVLVGIVLVSACLYNVGTPYRWGIKATFAATDAPPVDILDCLHFSAVTITTLGYGDYRPLSYGRLVAAAEALSGLVLMGIFVSRLVSRQQDRLSRRLARGQLNSEIQDFRDQLANLKLGFLNAAPLIPNHPSQLLYRAGGLAKAIGRYWRHEARDPDLTEIIQSSAAGRLVGDLIVLLTNIQVLAAGKQRASVHPQDIIQVRRAVESSLTVATVLVERMRDQSVEHSYQTIAALVQALRQQFDLRRTF
jgi:hypothetical protein